jgi:hypothetical protein
MKWWFGCYHGFNHIQYLETSVSLQREHGDWLAEACRRVFIKRWLRNQHELSLKVIFAKFFGTSRHNHFHDVCVRFSPIPKRIGQNLINLCLESLAEITLK